MTFLVIGNKPKKSLEEITSDLCPVLSIQQLYRISTMYWDDKYNTETVSARGTRGQRCGDVGCGALWLGCGGCEVPVSTCGELVNNTFGVAQVPHKSVRCLPVCLVPHCC